MTGQLLLDTHILIWLNRGDNRLTASALQRIQSAEILYCSAISCWEVAIKQNTGKLVGVPALSAYARQTGIAELPITMQHAELAGELPLHHRDPFDRMLVAQAICEGLTLVTADTKMRNYAVPVWLI